MNYERGDTICVDKYICQIVSVNRAWFRGLTRFSEWPIVSVHDFSETSRDFLSKIVTHNKKWCTFDQNVLSYSLPKTHDNFYFLWIDPYEMTKKYLLWWKPATLESASLLAMFLVWFDVWIDFLDCFSSSNRCGEQKAKMHWKPASKLGMSYSTDYAVCVNIVQKEGGSNPC